jgi:hypothetical protein
MADENTPYIQRNPGDIWTAEDWNGVQMKIKDDIMGKIQDAMEQIEKTGVQRADNADKFANKAPGDWVKDLDQRYAQKLHEHEGQEVYRRYHKRFSKEVPTAFLEHKLGRFPLVDIYEMMEVSPEIVTSGLETSDGNPAKFFLYYHHEESDRFKLDVKVYRDRAKLGIPLEAALTEYGVEWEEDDTLQDVRNDLWDKLFALPNDEISHVSSPWIEEKCIERSKVGELIENDEWQDIRLAFRPVKCDLLFCRALETQTNTGAEGTVRAAPPAPTTVPLRITHVNYDTMLVEIARPDLFLAQSFIDIMLLLRI